MRAAALCLLLAGPLAAEDFTSLKGHGGPVMALDVAADGTVASASFDNSVGLWTGRDPAWLEGHDAAVTAVDVSRFPVALTGGDDYRVLFWHPERAEPVEITKHDGKIGAIAVGPKGQRIATASWDGSIRLFAVEGFGPLAAPRQLSVLLDHRSNVTDVAYASDGTLYSASSDGTIRMWQGDVSRVLVKQPFGINRVVVTDDWIAYGAVDGATRIVDRDGNEIADFTLERRPILSMDYHAATGQLAVGDGHGYIMMIDTGAWRIARDFRAMRQGPVWALAFSPDGARIWAGGIEDTVFGWPVELLGSFDAIGGETRSFLKSPETMSNGERQFMRKCSICHALSEGASRKAGPNLFGVFGRKAGTLAGYRYSDTLEHSDIVWNAETIDALFALGPDDYIPNSKMPMQRIAREEDRRDLIEYMRSVSE